MNNSLKIIVTISLPGVIGKRQSNAEVIPYEYNTDVDEKKIPTVKGAKLHKGRVEKECSQNIKMTQDAYDYFTSNFTPSWSKDFIWSKLTPEERVKQHLAVIADGKPFTFEILE